MTQLDCWPTSGGWVAGMTVAWFTLVPSVLSANAWALAAVAGPILIVSAATFRATRRPAFC